MSSALLARGELWRRVLSWAGTFAELRHSPLIPVSENPEQIACGRLALQTARHLVAGASVPARLDLLVLALANARAGVRALLSVEAPAVSASDLPRKRTTPQPALLAIVEREVEQDIQTAPDRCRQDLALLLSEGERLLEQLTKPRRKARARRLRAWLVAVLPPLVIVLLLVTCAWPFVGAREVSAGKPWTTSSVGLVCDPAHQLCGGVQTHILFHTLDEAQPWFEIDLGTEHDVSRIEVRNRIDCCAERAVPLVVEVSVDHVHYRTVAHKFTAFDQWQQRFPTARARYVRIRVTRSSILHLEQVRVFGKRAVGR